MDIKRKIGKLTYTISLTPAEQTLAYHCEQCKRLRESADAINFKISQEQINKFPINDLENLYCKTLQQKNSKQV